MRRSSSLILLCLSVAVAAPSMAQTKPGRVAAPPAMEAKMAMPVAGDGKADVAISFERMILSDNLRAAVRARDYRKVNDILVHLGPAVSPGGPAELPLCPPPNIVQGGRCTLPFKYYIDFATENAK